KFSVAVLVLLGVCLGCTAWLVIRHQTRQVEQEALERSRTILSLGEAARQYARETLSPAVRKAVEPHGLGLVFEADSATFLVPGGVSDAFRQRHPEYSCREAALNPLNQANLADDEERQLIDRFRQNGAGRKVKEQHGFRQKDGKEQFYVARPIVVQPVCLQC